MDPSSSNSESDELIVPELTKARIEKLEADTEQAETFAQKSLAENTRRAYKTDWSFFCAWCEDRDLTPLPATQKTVALYVASVSEEYKLSSLERKLSAISQAHNTAGYDSPALVSNEPLHSVWAGIVRSKTRAKNKVAPALTEDIRVMVENLPTTDRSDTQLTLSGLRDRAILLIGFAGALRRSEIVRLTTEDVTFTAEGLRMIIRTSKSDQEGRGHVKGIHYGDEPSTCPVRSLRSWLQTAEIHSGPLFRSIDRWDNISDSALSGQAIANIIKKAARRAGLDPSDYSGHSLRAGFTTQAARSGIPERVIMRHTGHKSQRMVREYIREGRLFNENPTDNLGL